MNIYVGNLSYNTTDQELQDLFSPYGSVVSARVISDRFTGRSRGFGFVEMSDDDTARKAIAELDGQDFQGRSLRVNESQPREKQGGGGGGGGYRGGGGGGGGGYRGGGGGGGQRGGGREERW
jgi:RNA recognition motif-containing protein